MHDDFEHEGPEPILQRWAAAIGFATFAINLWLCHVLLRWLHVGEIEELKYPRFNDDGDEVTSDLTYAGLYALIVSAMVARRLYMLLKTGSLKYHLDPEDALAWNVWFVALTVFTVFIYALDAVVPSDVPARGLVWPALTLAVGWTAYRVYKRMVRTIV